MISRAPWISWGSNEASLVLFDGRDGSYHALNEAGSAIWKALSAGRQPSDVVELLVVGRSDLRAVISADVDEFVAAALGKGLLVAE